MTASGIGGGAWCDVGSATVARSKNIERTFNNLPV